MTKVTELRVYTVPGENMDEFVTGWRDLVIPIRKAFGFKVEAAWANREENRFSWVVSLEDGDRWDEAVAAYYESPERKSISPDPGRFVESVTTFKFNEELAH